MDLIAIHEIHFGVKPGTDKTPATIKIVPPGGEFECSDSEGEELVKMGAARVNPKPKAKAAKAEKPEKPKAEKAEKPKADKTEDKTEEKTEGGEGGSEDGDDDGEDMV